ncbi:helix-turn-helix transcriptional regulator [Sphaerisporangium viridialbum]|uniref:helix-turn-helix transcriptional regulator n=1 Tax=Sphaerisporangium viridialbum TaxID=46189 RepID=UPI003C72EC0C
MINARKRRGLSQEQAADAVQVSPTTWGRWERGVQEVRAVHRTRMAIAFQEDPAEIARWIDGDTALCPLADFWGGALTLTVKAAEELWRSELDPSRRHMLAALPFVPTAVGEWLAAWSYDPAPDSTAHRGSGPQVGMADVERISQAKQAFAQIDHQFGAGLVRPAVVKYLNGTVAPLLHGRYDDRVGSALMTAAADMTCLVGWMAFDIDRNGQAQRYFAQALRLAKAAGDPVMAAWVLGVMSHQAIYLNRPTEALRLANAAGEAARQGQAPPRLMGRLALGERAWATALQVKLSDTREGHSVKQVERLLAEAQRAYEQGPTDREPTWLPPYDPTRISSEAARCWHLLGEHQRAIECAESALSGLRGSRTRSAQLAHVNAAEAYLGAGELEQALNFARAATPVAKSLSSPRLVERVRGFSGQLDPYGSTVQVREFRDYMRVQLAA